MDNIIQNARRHTSSVNPTGEQCDVAPYITNMYLQKCLNHILPE